MTKRQKELFPDLPSDKKYVSDYPELVAEWHPTKNGSKLPEDVLQGSNKLAWWICSEGHDWKAAIYSRTQGRGCPYCAGKKPSPEYNFAALYPNLLAEWDFQKNSKPPDQFLPQSNKLVWWCCERGHEWEAPVYRRTGSGAGCPSCSNQTSKNELRIFTELAAVFENVQHRQKVAGSEVDVYLPDFCFAIEYDGKYWHREMGEQDQAKQEHLDALGVTLIRIREAPLTKLQDHDIILPMGSFITKATMDEVVMRLDAGSPYLSEQNFRAEETYLTYLDYFPSPFPENSLASANPELAKEWHPTRNSPLTPENFTQSAKPKVWWQCSEGHEWKAAIYSRNLGGHACPYCSGQKASEENNMAITHPWMAALFHPTKNGDFTPQNLKAGTGRLVYWHCQCGYEWQQTGDKLSRVTGEPCFRCRSLETKRPDIAAMWHPTFNGDLSPADVAFSSGEKRWWQCHKNAEHTWQATPNNMTAKNRKSFCPVCRKLGLQ